jgi:hypothetical protein
MSLLQLCSLFANARQFILMDVLGRFRQSINMFNIPAKMPYICQGITDNPLGLLTVTSYIFDFLDQFSQSASNNGRST